MRVIAKRTLRQFWERYPNAQGPLAAWHSETVKAHWKSPQQIKEQFGSASILNGGRVVFNIGGNKYRLVGTLKNSVFQRALWIVGETLIRSC